jgi:outer membrane protein OmpA-like peptidoglycan-associated protein
MKAKHIILTVAILLFTATSLSAQKNDDRRSVKVSGFELLQERGQVTIDFTLTIGKKAASRGNTLSIIPVLTNGDLAKELTPVVVRGRRAQILYERRFIASPHTAGISEPEVITAENGESLEYKAVIPFEEWMPGATLLLDGVDEGCCSAERTGLGLIADNLMVPESNFLVEEKTILPGRELTTGEKLAELFPFVRPAGDEHFSREGITIFFHQDRHNIDQEYRRNRQSLVDILSVVEELQKSESSDIDGIVIAGFASPEGRAAYNDRLSERRAEIVRKFIMDNSTLSYDRINIHIGGEDWEGLRELVAASNMEDRRAVLDIIDNVPVIGRNGQHGREAELMLLRSGATYKYMYDNFFPELREAAYITIYYKDK